MANKIARGILEKNRSILERGAELLLVKETLAESDLLQLFAGMFRRTHPTFHL
jgi:ATP-dependent Zn protease